MSKQRKEKPAVDRTTRDVLMARNLLRLETDIEDVRRAVHIAMLMVEDEEYRFKLGTFATQEAHKLAEKLSAAFKEAHAAAVAGKEWDYQP